MYVDTQLQAMDSMLPSFCISSDRPRVSKFARFAKSGIPDMPVTCMDRGPHIGEALADGTMLSKGDSRRSGSARPGLHQLSGSRQHPVLHDVEQLMRDHTRIGGGEPAERVIAELHDAIRARKRISHDERIVDVHPQRTARPRDMVVSKYARVVVDRALYGGSRGLHTRLQLEV